MKTQLTSTDKGAFDFTLISRRRKKGERTESRRRARRGRRSRWFPLRRNGPRRRLAPKTLGQEKLSLQEPSITSRSEMLFTRMFVTTAFLKWPSPPSARNEAVEVMRAVGHLHAAPVRPARRHVLHVEGAVGVQDPRHLDSAGAGRRGWPTASPAPRCPRRCYLCRRCPRSLLSLRRRVPVASSSSSSSSSSSAATVRS